MLKAILLACALVSTACAQPTLGWFTGNGNGWTNHIYAGVSAKIGLWSTAIIYDTGSTIGTNTGIISLTWDRTPDGTNGTTFTNIAYTVYYGDLIAGGPTNAVPCSTNRYVVFFNLRSTNSSFFFVTAKELTTGVESLPSNLLIAPPIP